ncbi:MAG TPA: hypothetical protein V6D50_13485 [Chroococcales cyanobacterium]
MKKAIFPLLGSVLLELSSLVSIADIGWAQSTVSPCQPPQSDEYLLFILSRTPESQKQIQRTLPADTPYTFCQYLDDTVTRIAGFRRVEDAEAWGRYVQEIVGLSAFVVRPTSANQSSNAFAYNPQALGEGYAVLVDYFNQPEVAAQVRQLLGRDVGLVSYGQRPYLLAIHTTSQRKANSTLRQLSDRGFWSMVVDSRRVTLLKPSVSF